MRHALLALMLLSPGAALADGCPVAPDHTRALDALYEALQSAENDMEGRAISNQMWQYWTDAPDEPSQGMLDEAMRARGYGDYAFAMDRLNRLVSYCPFYAEGYNQRAFVHFLSENYLAALPDLDQALSINPRHLGALSGKGLTLLALGRDEEAQAILRAAVALNPWMSERFLLKPTGDEL